MHRDVSALTDQTFDLLVVGGGITGSFIALEAARSGLKTALIERYDYGHATSSRNSRLIHGGLRYLKQGQFGQVREGLVEREFWLDAAPAYVRPLRFWMPVTSTLDRLQLRAGLWLYDRMAGSRQLGRAEQVGNQQLSEAFPWLDVGRFSGGVRYYDAQMISPERLLLAVLRRAQEAGGVTCNYVEAKGVRVDGNQVIGLDALDRESAMPLSISAKNVFSATGPWVGQWMGASRPRVLLSSGVHLIVPRLVDEALAMSSETGHFFLLPWRKYTIIGTTDRAFAGHADDFQKDSVGIEQVVTKVQSGLPELEFDASKIVDSYVGLRALAAGKGDSTYTASRESVVTDHGQKGGPQGLWSAVGGKWTTSRALARKALRRVFPGRTASFNDALIAGEISAGEIQTPYLGQHKDYFAALYADQLPHLDKFASALPEVFELDAPAPLCSAQVLFAVRHESALSIRDFLFRRVQQARLGTIPASTLEAIANLMGREKSWSEQRRSDEISGAQSEVWES